MIAFLQKRWWKFLSIVFLFPALLAGLLIPLSPGVGQISPKKITAGTSGIINIIGYNTHFGDRSSSTDVVLKKGGNTICASSVQVLGPRELNADFEIPANMPVNPSGDYYNIIVHNDVDGTFFLRDGVLIETAKPDSEIADISAYAACLYDFGTAAPDHLTYPYREILYESIRNLFFHVPMWFSMILLLIFSFAASIRYLSKGDMIFDVISSRMAAVGLFYGALGILTGMQWANFTWGAPWPNDPKLNGAAVGMLIYLAYFVLRGSLKGEQARARVSSVYNIFAFVIFVVFIFVIPRLTDSLHPGSGGNPGFNTYDLDNVMRPVFYSAVIGFAGVGFWIASLWIRYHRLVDKLISQNH